MGYMDRRDMRTYRGSFQGNGCLSGCMFHLVCMGLLVLAGVVWVIKERAWELTVTVELPKVEKVAPEAEESER